MKSWSTNHADILIVTVLFIASVVGMVSSQNIVSCPTLYSPCFGKKVYCPAECPYTNPADSNAKACFLNCNSPKCEAMCRNRKPDCNGYGAGCYDPRFVGGDGVMFYFHGRRNEHFTLVSDPELQINARFIGLRPAGRSRDFTWIQALGIMSGQLKFTVEATRAAQWDEEMDHLQFLFGGKALDIPVGHRSEWKSPEKKLTVVRTATTNSVTVTLDGIAEVSINVVPVTEEDDRIHSYHIPNDDCFAHLEVQFRFYTLSPEVEGVLGKTYRPDFVNPAKQGVAMPVVGGEDKYQTSSLLSPECKLCRFSSVAES